MKSEKTLTKLCWTFNYDFRWVTWSSRPMRLRGRVSSWICSCRTRGPCCLSAPQERESQPSPTTTCWDCPKTS